MLRRFSINFAIFSIILDSILVMLSLHIAHRLRPGMNALPFTAYVPPDTVLPGILYPVFAITWVGVLLLLAVYDGRRNLRVVDEFTSLLLGSMLASISMAGILYLSFRTVSRFLFLVFVSLGFSSMLAWRLGARLAFRLNNGQPTHVRRVLIAGAGLVGWELWDKLEKNTFLGLQAVGFLDDDPEKQRRQPVILGSLRDTRQVVIERQVDDVVVALPQRAYEQVNRLVAELHSLPVKVWVIPDYFRLALHKAVVEEFAGIPMFDLRAPALNDYQRLMKRSFDLTITVLSLPVILPLMGLITLLIHLEGGGPAIFRQQRVGENGRLFRMYKFRTMVPEAETLRELVEEYDASGRLLHKHPDDPRVTRMGHFLRRTSLDELPQVFNILKGEMSLVGPRPELPYLVQQYEPWQHKRLAVPQGITGWWQVNGRSTRPMHLHTEDDIYYVQNYSLMLDIQILVKTVGVVVRGKGAW